MIFSLAKWGAAPVTVFFVLLFLPLSLFAYYVAPAVWRKEVLCTTSFLFFLLAAPWQFPIMLVAVGGTYLLIRQMGYFTSQTLWRKRLFLVLAIGLNLLLWLSFSVYSAGHASFYTLGGSVLPLMQIQAVLMAYKNANETQVSFRDYSSHILFYPRLYLGPLSNIPEFFEGTQWEKPAGTNLLLGFWDFLKGAIQFLLFGIGLLDSAEQIYHFYPKEVTTLSSWVAVVFTALGTYHTLCGFSYMVQGIGKMYHLSFFRDTNQPFSGGTLKAFWQRWHSSLFQWVEEVAAPVQKKLPFSITEGLLMLCKGIFFGLWMNFRLEWGLWGLLLALGVWLEEKLDFAKQKEKRREHIFMGVVLVIIFFIASWGGSGWNTAFLNGILLRGALYNQEVGYLLTSQGVLHIGAVFFATTMPSKLVGYVGGLMDSKYAILQWVIGLGFLLLLLALLV